MLRFEALVEELVADESQQELKFDISLTGYQVRAQSSAQLAVPKA